MSRMTRYVGGGRGRPTDRRASVIPSEIGIGKEEGRRGRGHIHRGISNPSTIPYVDAQVSPTNIVNPHYGRPTTVVLLVESR